MSAVRNRSHKRTGSLKSERCSLAQLIEREQIRAKIEKAIQRLIDALDAIDGDPDLEPSLGYTLPGVANDAEDDAADGAECDAADDEPSLAARETMNQDHGWGDRCAQWDFDLEIAAAPKRRGPAPRRPPPFDGFIIGCTTE